MLRERPCHSGQHGEAWRSTGRSGGRGRGTRCGQEPFLWFPWEGMAEARSAGVGLASWNNFRGLWRLGNDPHYLVPGIGMIKAGVQWPEGERARGGRWLRVWTLDWLVCT